MATFSQTSPPLLPQPPSNSLFWHWGGSIELIGREFACGKKATAGKHGVTPQNELETIINLLFLTARGGVFVPVRFRSSTAEKSAGWWNH